MYQSGITRGGDAVYYHINIFLPPSLFAQWSPWVGVTQASWHKQNCSSAAFTSSEALLLMLGQRMRDTREFVSLFQHEQKVISTSLSHC